MSRAGDTNIDDGINNQGVFFFYNDSGIVLYCRTPCPRPNSRTNSLAPHASNNPCQQNMHHNHQKALVCCEMEDLEVRLLQDADQLVHCPAPGSERVELLEDVLDQLHVVLPHCLQLGLLKLLMGLGFSEDKTHVTSGSLSISSRGLGLLICCYQSLRKGICVSPPGHLLSVDAPC